jgi:biopolymer transport protein TolR
VVQVADAAHRKEHSWQEEWISGTAEARAKKPLDAALNLVPFIDLMAVTIVFLIMTAVWTQLGRLQVSQAGQSTDDQTPPNPNDLNINLRLTEKKLKLTVG